MRELVIQNTQTTSWQEFQTGNYAFGENGTWQKAAPRRWARRSSRSRPRTGERRRCRPAANLHHSVQKAAATYATSAKIVQCLSSTTNIVTTDNTLNYIAPTQAGQQAQVSADGTLSSWVSAVGVAKAVPATTSATKYPIISQQL